MAAYMIFIREGKIFDPAKMDAYRNSNRNDTHDYRLSPLVVYGDLETLEGKAADGIVVLQFPTMDDARRWYYSPGYQSAAEHRKRAADYRVFLVEGI